MCKKSVIAADVEESIKSGGLAAIKTERIKVRLPQNRTVYQDALGLCVNMRWTAWQHASDCVSTCNRTMHQDVK